MGSGVRSMGDVRRKPRSKDAGVDGCCSGGKKRCAACMERFLESLHVQAVVFGLVGVLVCGLNIISHYSMHVMDEGYFSRLQFSLFAPLLSAGVYTIFAVVTVVKVSTFSKYHKVMNFCKGLFLVVSLCVFILMYYSIVIQFYFGHYLSAVGKLSSLEPVAPEANDVNDFTLSLFQGCCVNRGWAFYNIGSCTNPNETQQCPYSSFGEICSCYHNEEKFQEYVGSMTQTFCMTLQYYQTVPLIGEPSKDSCGATVNNQQGTGLPNGFQIQYSAYFQKQVQKWWIILLVLVIPWSLSQIIGHSTQGYRFMHAKRQELKRQKRRLELMKRRLKTRTGNASTSIIRFKAPANGEEDRSPLLPAINSFNVV